MKKYRTVYEQGFIPIFARDDYPTDVILEGCAMAGLKAIEYTMRRGDAREVIPSLRDRYPYLTIIAGSTLDSDKIVNQMSLRHPQLMTIDILSAYQVDGFVSMLGWKEKRIRDYSMTHLLFTGAFTMTEALNQMDAGAHFIKLLGSNLELVRLCRAESGFDFCPMFVTGGMSLERIPEAVEAGAVLIGTGCEVVLVGISPDSLTPGAVCERMLLYQNTVKKARAKAFPKLENIETLDDREWFSRLPHYHPFSFE